MAKIGRFSFCIFLIYLYLWCSFLLKHRKVLSGILEGLKEKLGGGVLDAVKEKLNLENMDLGSLAQSVLSIIGLAGNSVATEEEAEVVEEETVVEEE